ncbi:MAG: hypothetical protein FD174_2583 [Geobacteraceae bacterium]|nr:MAG: hypothetical protein FD174_2583 [Geobacteraceae bacterium]
MRVKIVAYDQRKGKGLLSTGEAFSYTQFENQLMIPPGEWAELIDGVLYPCPVTWWSRLWLKIKEVLRWR